MELANGFLLITGPLDEIRNRSRPAKSPDGRIVESVYVCDDLIAAPVVVLLRAPGFVGVGTRGVTIGVRDVRGAFRMPSKHARLRADIERPRLRIHSTT